MVARIINNGVPTSPKKATTLTLGTSSAGYDAMSSPSRQQTNSVPLHASSPSPSHTRLTLPLTLPRRRNNSLFRKLSMSPLAATQTQSSNTTSPRRANTVSNGKKGSISSLFGTTNNKTAASSSGRTNPSSLPFLVDLDDSVHEEEEDEEEEEEEEEQQQTVKTKKQQKQQQQQPQQQRRDRQRKASTKDSRGTSSSSSSSSSSSRGAGGCPKKRVSFLTNDKDQIGLRVHTYEPVYEHEKASYFSSNEEVQHRKAELKIFTSELCIHHNEYNQCINVLFDAPLNRGMRRKRSTGRRSASIPTTNAPPNSRINCIPPSPSTSDAVDLDLTEDEAIETLCSSKRFFTSVSNNQNSSSSCNYNSSLSSTSLSTSSSSLDHKDGGDYNDDCDDDNDNNDEKDCDSIRGLEIHISNALQNYSKFVHNATLAKYKSLKMEQKYDDDEIARRLASRCQQLNACVTEFALKLGHGDATQAQNIYLEMGF